MVLFFRYFKIENLKLICYLESSNSSMMNIDPDEDPEQALMKAMGLSGFNTTKVNIFWIFFDLFNLYHGFWFKGICYN